MTCSRPRRPPPPPRPRAAAGPEEAPPVDGRAGVAARVVADTHMALVQLHGDVVIVPVVQQDPVVLCRGDLRSKATSLQPHPPQQQRHRPVGGAHGAALPCLPRWRVLPGALTEAGSPRGKPHPLTAWPGPGSRGQRGRLRPGNGVPGGAGKSPSDHLLGEGSQTGWGPPLCGLRELPWGRGHLQRGHVQEGSLTARAPNLKEPLRR